MPARAKVVLKCLVLRLYSFVALFGAGMQPKRVGADTSAQRLSFRPGAHATKTLVNVSCFENL